MVLNSVSQIRKNEDLKNSINMYKFNKNEKTDTNMITDNLKIDGEKSAFSSFKDLKHRSSCHNNSNNNYNNSNNNNNNNNNNTKNQTQSTSWAQMAVRSPVHVQTM